MRLARSLTLIDRVRERKGGVKVIVYSLYSPKFGDCFWVASSLGRLVALIELDIGKAALKVQRFSGKDDLFVAYQTDKISHMRALIKTMTFDRPCGYVPGYLYRVIDGTLSVSVI